MRRLVMAALATLGAAFLFSQALAAPVNIVAPIDPITKAVLTQEVSPVSGMVLLKPSWFTFRFVYGADGVSAGYAGSNFKATTVDSTPILEPTIGFNRLAIFLTITYEDSVAGGLFAIQWRGAPYTSSTDTANTYVPLGQWTGTDTLGTFVNALPSGLYAAGVGAWGSSRADTAACYDGERPLILVRDVSGSGRIIPIKIGEEWFTPPFIGLRMRIMNTYAQLTGGGGMVAIGNNGKLLGTGATFGAVLGICETCGGQAANSANVGKYIQVRGDLVGWRE